VSGLIHPPKPPQAVAPATPGGAPAPDTKNGAALPPANGADDATRKTMLIVTTPHDEKARSAVESLLDGLAKEWHLESMESNDLEEEARLRYSVRTKKRLDAVALVSAINAAGASQGIHAEMDGGAAPKQTPAPAPATSS
jgi:hypothetical protein